MSSRDVIDGTPVIKRLKVGSLQSGTHRYYFRVIENGIGGYHHVPVMVARGFETGPSLFLQAAIHGDELQGIQVVQQVMANIDPEQLRGTVVGLPAANATGIHQHSKDYYASSDGGQRTNLNRLMPGKNSGDQAGNYYAHALWNRLYSGNVDVFLDLHTQSRGTSYPFFVFADRRNAVVDRLVRVIPADQVKDDTGDEGSVETEMVKAGIPAMTLELGAPKVYHPKIAARAVQGIVNILIELGMLEGEIDMLGVETFYGNDMTSVHAERGGFADILVDLNADVEEGQPIARQTNVFGDVIKEYKAPWAGKVLSVATDPLREPGSLLVRLLRAKNDG